MIRLSLWSIILLAYATPAFAENYDGKYALDVQRQCQAAADVKNYAIMAVYCEESGRQSVFGGQEHPADLPHFLAAEMDGYTRAGVARIAISGNEGDSRGQTLLHVALKIGPRAEKLTSGRDHRAVLTNIEILKQFVK